MCNSAVRLTIGGLFILAAAVGVTMTRANAQSNSSAATSAGDVRELRTLLGHSDGVYSVRFSPDGRTIASGSYDKTIRLWDAASGQELRVLQGHLDVVNSVVFSPDGRTIASASADKTIKLWDAVSGGALRTLQWPSTFVYSVMFSPDGQTIASASNDPTIKLWDVASGRELRTLRGHSGFVGTVAFSPDGRTIASGGNDRTIKLWDVASGRELRTLRGHSDSVQAIAFLPDGRTIVSGGLDKTVKLWDSADGRELRTLQGHSSGVTSVAASPDGRMIASGSDRTVKFWDAASGRELRTLGGHSAWIYSVAFSPDSRIFASGSGDKAIKLWDVSALVAAPAAIPSGQVAPPPTTAVAALVNTATPATIVAPALERRVALVIGNSAYRKVQHLPNPSRDADLIGAALRSAGIDDVTIAHDLDRDGMVKALQAFSKKADAADWAVIYFAGHGIEIGGTNYLIPVDAKLDTDRDVPDEAIPLEQLQSRLAGAHKLKLIVLDACRNNPFASQMKMTVAKRSVNRGFTRVEPSGATLVVYAAKEGTTAIDGDGIDSPFAVSFAKRIVEQGVEINKALRFVRQDVLVATGSQQEPFVYGSLPPDDFYFVPPK